MKTKKIILTVIVLITISCSIPKNSFSQTPDSSRFGIFSAYQAVGYSYFMDQMGFNYNPDYTNWVDNHFQNLGAHWTRSTLELIWNAIEPNLDGNYVWNIGTKPDSVITNIYDSPAQVEWLGCIDFDAMHNPLNYPTQWKNYLQAVVDRYNGDGLNDLNSYVKVKHWQIGNETWEHTDFTSAQYAQVIAMADTAIHSLDPSAKICLIAPTGNVIDTFFVNIITKLGLMNINFEIIDIHQWGLANNYKMTTIPVYRSLLNANGYSNVKIWSCENGTYCYQPPSSGTDTLFYQSQNEQAASLIKRYVWNFSNGLDKLMWNNLMEWYEFAGNPGSIFNSMGLIGDGRQNNEPPNELNFKRKNYYSYKLLASTIDSYYATYISNNSFHNEPNGNYGYIYQDNNTGDNFDIFWTDSDSATYNFTITSNYQLTEMIPYNSLGNFMTQSFLSGAHNITIYKNKVYLFKKLSDTGIQNTEHQNSLFNIYPNPFSSTTTLQTDKIFKDATLTVYNSFGKQVKQIKNIYGQTITLHRDNLPSGLYFIRLTEENKTITTDKLIVAD